MLCPLVLALATGLTAAPTSTSTETLVIYGPRTTAVPWLDDPTAAAHTIDVLDRVAVSETLGDVLVGVPGVRVRRSGGEGAFEGLSIRGGEPNHTAVLIGDVPVQGVDRGAVDLSLLPLQAFERVEIFRGGAPAWFDQGQIGGVVRLLPRLGSGRMMRAEVGAGSFGGYWGRAEAGFRGDSTGVVLAATARTRANDYAFLDDGATPFVSSDDQVRRRRNARSTQVHGFAHADWESGRHRLEGLALAVHRNQGEPGPGHRQAVEAERARTRVLGALSYGYRADDVRVHAVASGAWERDRFKDEEGEIGLDREDVDDRFSNLSGRLAAAWDVASWFQGTFVGHARYDRYDPENTFATPGDQPSSRSTFGATVEGRAHGRLGQWALETRPSVALRFSEATLVDRNRGIGEIERRSVSEVLPTFRLGLFASAASWLAVQGSLFSGRRLPTVLELFGNRGNIVASPALRPERSLGGDLALLMRRALRVGRQRLDVRLELRGFATWIDDLIRFRRNGVFEAVAENVEFGRITGVEAALQLKLPAWLYVNGQLTWLDARDDIDRRLPFRPPWTGYAEVEMRSGSIVSGWLDGVRGRVEWATVSESPVDPANLVRIDPRSVWSAALTTHHDGERLQLSVQMRDLFDVGGADLLGFPLPGRRIDVAVSWTERFE